MRERVEDEDLADGAARREAEYVPADGGVCGCEGEGVGELAVTRGGEAEPGAEGCAGDVGGDEEVADGEGGAHDVLRAHHLWAGEAFECAEDLVLHGVREAVEEEIYAEEEEADGLGGVGAEALFRGFLCGGGVVQGEDGNAEGDAADDEVFV